MSAEVRARWVIVHRAPCILIRGRSSADVLRRFGFKPLWSVNGKGWVLDDEHLPDVTAIAGMRTRGVRVVHEDGANCECVDVRAERRDIEADPSEVLCTCSSSPRVEDHLVDLLEDNLGAVEVGHVHRGTAS